MEVQESRREIPTHCCSKGYLRLDTLKNAGGIVSFHPPHPCPKVTEPSTRETFLTCDFFPWGKWECVTSPAMWDADKVAYSFLAPSSIVRCAIQLGDIEGLGRSVQGPQRASKGNRCYQLLYELHQEAYLRSTVEFPNWLMGTSNAPCTSPTHTLHLCSQILVHMRVAIWDFTDG